MPIIEGLGDEVVVWFTLMSIVFMMLATSLRRKIRLTAESDSEDEGLGNAPPIHNPQTCPICWNNQTLALETNCGHLYCGLCLLRLHEENIMQSRDLKCPLCRQNIVILFQWFTPEEREAQSQSELGIRRSQVRSFANTYNRIHSSGEIRLMDRIREVPVLLRHMFNEIRGAGVGDIYLTLRLYVIIIGSTLYLIFPYDLFSEWSFGLFGFIDDVILIGLVSYYLATLYRHYLLNNNG